MLDDKADQALSAAPDTRASSLRRSTLVVVGTGIQWAGQTTLAARRAIQTADRVLFALADPWGARWVRSLNPSAESFVYGQTGTRRRDIYARMVDQVLSELERHARVCAAFYGSPTLLTQPAHDAIRRARAAGHSARMLPGVSSLDCLCADLGVDPGERGLELHEASAFLARKRALQVDCHVVLCQVALLGQRSVFDPDDLCSMRLGLHELQRRLSLQYPAQHPLCVYEASLHPLLEPRITEVALDGLADVDLNETASLYIPPLDAADKRDMAPTQGRSRESVR